MNHIIKLEKYKSQTDSGLQYQKMIPIKSTQRKQDQENTTKMKCCIRSRKKNGSKNDLKEIGKDLKHT